MFQHEAASAIDVPDLDYAMQVSQERLIAAWQPLRQAHTAALLQQVKDATAIARDASWIDGLSLAPASTIGLVAGVEAAIEEGRQTALAEAHRQTLDVASMSPARDPVATSRVAAYAQSAERLLAASLVQTARREAFRLSAAIDHWDVEAAVATVLGDSSTRYERDILQGMATGGVNEGRYHVMESILGEASGGLLQAADAVSSIYALEILDGNTCDPCAAIDGQEYASLAAARVDYPGIGGGYVACDGRERCRGSLVIVYATEAQSFGDQPPPITPDIVPPTPPPTPPPPPVSVEESIRVNGEKLLATYREQIARLAPGFGQNLSPEVREALASRDAVRATLQEHGIAPADPASVQIEWRKNGAPARRPSDDRMARKLYEATQVYPQDWIDALSKLNDGAIRVEKLGAAIRSSYNTFDKAMSLSSDTSIGVNAHELGHGMEAVFQSGQFGERLTDVQKSWLSNRAKPGEKPVKVPGRPNEIFILDELPDFYTGRIYSPKGTLEGPSLHYEVFTTGIQALAGDGSKTMSAIRADDDHIRFVLGVLATLRP